MLVTKWARQEMKRRRESLDLGGIVYHKLTHKKFVISDIDYHHHYQGDGDWEWRYICRDENLEKFSFCKEEITRRILN